MINGRHDDQADALTQLLGWVRQRDQYSRPPIVSPMIVTGASRLMRWDDGGENGLRGGCRARFRLSLDVRQV